MSAFQIIATVVLIGASAFFVAIEFALIAARNYRLEEAAQTSAAARAALRSSRDISVLLAGSQLGITLCVLGLGAISKPAVDYALRPVLEGWGIPGGIAGVASFVISLIVVTFLHLVVGEMAPKSWAISHPERSAILLALPMRAFMVTARPVLLLLNGAANRCLRLCGVQPVDEMASGRNADDLRQLVDHSAKTGTLDQGRRDQLVTALELERTPLGELAREPAAVAADDDVAAVQATCRRTGHLRLVVRDGDTPIGYVHVRDTLTREPGTLARDLMRPVLTLPADTQYHTAVNTMREQRAHLALVESDGRPVGVVTLSDLVERLLQEPV
ncbi:CNNM domain-containing protein [Pseudonocardia sp. ICBG1293]|uniref:CNNM domain-containing protein n=1 Tax=Pseudonocardia sp. ICBG1293 TaxID=2844382 RepID=UPI001CC9EFF0|nr:CNNM domain-containing protein [Pseudonocardia sp. ICBG1293]